MTISDMAIRDTFVDFNANSPVPVTADEILCDPGLEDRFWEQAAKRVKPSGPIDRVASNRRLLALRKLGEANGGLPKTH